MYRNLILEDGKSYTVHDKVADAYEDLKKKKDMEMPNEEDMKKKKDMELNPEKKAKEADEEEMEEEEKMKMEEKKKKDAKTKAEEEEFRKILTPEEWQALMKKKDDEEGEEEEKEKFPFKKKDMKKMNSLQSQLEAAKAEAKALRIRLNSNQAEEEKTNEVKERVNVLNSASKILKCDSDELVDQDALTIKTKVVNHVFPDMITDGKDENYITAIFDVACEEKGKTFTKILDNAMDKNDDFFQAANKKKGKKDESMEKAYMERRKNAYMKPVSGSYDEDYAKSSQKY